MNPHAAGVLGAVLSPTDAAAVAGLAKKLPRRSLTVLKAESLINDGTALVLFAVSVHVAVGGTAISPPEVTARFVGSYLGGIAAGLLVGGAVTLLRKRIDAPQEEGALSLVTPFAAFLLAQSMHCSGVVAVMVSALVLAYAGPVVIRARSRLRPMPFGTPRHSCSTARCGCSSVSRSRVRCGASRGSAAESATPCSSRW
jgi:CPA1 family monovalent cation:H+ antiporter